MYNKNLAGFARRGGTLLTSLIVDAQSFVESWNTWIFGRRGIWPNPHARRPVSRPDADAPTPTRNTWTYHPVPDIA